MKRSKLLTLFAAALMLLGVQSANAVTLQVVDGTNGGSIARLVDGNNGSKWEGGFNGGQYVILKNAANLPVIPGNYTIVTGNDNASWNGRGWKAWKIFGANFAYDAAASRDAADWVLLDEKSDITQDIVPDVNSTPFDFNFSEAITQGYVYFKIEVLELQGAGYMQMCEFILNDCTVDSSFADVLTSYDPSESDADLANAYAEGLAALSAATTTEETEAAMSTLAGLRQKMETINSGRFVALSWAAGNWGDGPGSNLVDKKENTKWGGNFDGTNPQYVIFRGKSMQPFFYKLVTGNDTAGNTGRNWKTWKVFGGNFNSEADATKDAEGWVVLDNREDVTEEYLPMKNFYPATFDFNQGVSEAYSYYKVEVYAPHSGTQHQMSEMYLCTQEEFEAIRAPYVEEFAEFAAGLDALEVESDMEASKTTFAELYAELQTTSDAVRLTKIYNELVALRDALLESSAFATGGYRCLSGNTAWGDGENWTKLVDGDTTTKWGGGMPEGGSYVIFKTYAANTFNQYMLVTGNDTKNSPGRNWKTWKIYGCNAKGGDTSATRDATWTLIDEKTDIGQDRLPAANYAPAYFNFTNPKGYKYFKIEVEAAYSGDAIQMSEFKFLSDEEYATICQEYADSVQKIAMGLMALEEGIDLPAEKKEQLVAQITTAITEKIKAISTATADNLLPLFNSALNYINVEVPALIATEVAIANIAVVDGVYQLATAKDLSLFATLVNAGTNEAKAVLTADIDMEGTAMSPIGTNANPYKGSFDGQGFTIANYTYNESFGSNLGLFGTTNGATIQKVLLQNANILGRANVGGIVGNANNSTINCCAVVNSTISGHDHVATIAGNAAAGAVVSNCYSNSDVVSDQYQAGGLVGTVLSGAVIEKNLFAGTVKCENGGNASGLVSLIDANDANPTIRNNVVAAVSVEGGSTFTLVNADGRAATYANNFILDTTVYSTGAKSVSNENDQNGKQISLSEATKADFYYDPLGWDMTNDWQYVARFVFPVLAYMEAVVPAEDIAVTGAGYATYFTKAELDFGQVEGVEAYIPQLVNDEYVHLEPITYVPAGVGIVVKAAAGTYNIPYSRIIAKDVPSDLKAAPAGFTATGKEYILAKPEGEAVGFYKAEGVIAEGKGYLEISGEAGVKGFYGFEFNDATGIEETLSNSPLKGENIFNLAGQRLNKMQKGINIVAGKKVLK